jgi:uncharacterized protein (DUF433 family)
MSGVSVEHICVDEKGVARIAGRRTKVYQIVLDKRKLGTVEEIQRAYPDLRLAEIHAALAYYYDHQEEIDSQIDEYRRLSEEIRAKTENPGLVERLRERMSKS